MKTLLLSLSILLWLPSAAQVTSVTGTANQVTATPATGAVTLSLPQSIATTSNVQFGKISTGTAPVAFANIYNAAPMTGASTFYGNFIEAVAQSNVTFSARGYATILSTQAATFTIGNIEHFRAQQGTIGAGSTLTNQYGFTVSGSLTGATNNYGFYGNIPSGTGRWNLYMNGTANNYLNGNTLIGTTTNNGSKLQVNGSATISGKIGIGTTSPTEKLSVNGNIRAKEIKVEVSGWPDFIFEPSFKLPDLGETERFIKENKHLPAIPSAAEVAESGISLGEMNAKLLQKIEELTLHLIELNKENSGIKERLFLLEEKN